MMMMMMMMMKYRKIKTTIKKSKSINLYYNNYKLLKTESLDNVGKNSRYFVGVFNRKIFPLAFVRYERITAKSALRASLDTFHLISTLHSWYNC